MITFADPGTAKPDAPPSKDPDTQYRMQRVFSREGRTDFDGEPIYLKPATDTDDAALEAFGRLLGHFYDGLEGESFILLAPGGRLLGCF